MSHFAIFAPPLRGHYAPLSALAAELVARGHRVTFVHQEEARALVTADGAEFAAVGADMPPLDSWTRPMARIRSVVGLGGTMRGMQEMTTMLCREGPELLRRIGVDAVIADQLEPAGGLVSACLRIPWVTIATTLPMNREAGIPPPYLSWAFDPSARGLNRNRGGWRISDWLLRGVNRSIARNSEALRLPSRRRMEDCFSPLLQLSQMVPEMDFPRSCLPSTFHYTGPLRSDREDQFKLPPSDGRRTVYCTFGTLQGSRTALFAKVAEACARLNLRLVITHGGQGDDRALRGLPGAPLVYDWLPQRSVLRQVDLALCHGGFNSVLDPLEAGVPLVVIPLAFEQSAIAARVVHCGAGLAVARGASVSRLANAIGAVLADPRYRERARGIAAAIGNAGGAARAADLIEGALASAVPEAATTGRAARDDARGDTRSGNS